jgi:hypothetical protein
LTSAYIYSIDGQLNQESQENFKKLLDDPSLNSCLRGLKVTSLNFSSNSRALRPCNIPWSLAPRLLLPSFILFI